MVRRPRCPTRGRCRSATRSRSRDPSCVTRTCCRSWTSRSARSRSP